MSLIKSTNVGSSGSFFYNGVATQSLRLDTGRSTFLSRTPADAGNRKTWTWSSWVKRAIFGSNSIFEAGTANNNSIGIQFDNSTRSLQFFAYDGTNVHVNVTTTRKFRDASAWYHIVVAFDTTQNTASDRVKVYVNGVQETSFSATDYPSKDTDYNINNDNLHQISRSVFGSTFFFNGYLAEINFIDGLALAASSFGETKNGIWIPINTSGLTFGTNGFRLNFEDNAVDAPESEGTIDTDNIGADSSGEHNNWTSSGIVASDCAMPDSPENNFCTLNSLESDKKFADANQSLMTQSEANLKFSGGRNVYGTIGVNSGKWYWEIINTSSTVNSVSVSGVITQGTQAQVYGVYYNRNGNKGLGLLNSGATESSYGATYTDDDVISVALNMDDNQITFFKNNASQGTITDANIAGGHVTAWTQNGANSGTLVGVYNFGQDASFAEEITAGTETDGNGAGVFKYAPPSGFLALCSANLPEPIIGPNSGDDEQASDYFNTVLWTGSNNARSIDDVGFQPDWVWSKCRSTSSTSHRVHDSVRGDNGTVMFQLHNDNPNVEGTDSLITGFDAEGFNIAAGSAHPNISGRTFVAWNWKANGGTSTTNDASSTSIGSRDSVFQANTTAGFSIVTYTGDGGTGVDTYRHGLQVNGVATTPELIIIKNRQNTDDWLVGITTIPSFNWVNDYMHWNEPEQHQTNANGTGFKAAPTSTVFSVGEFLNKGNNYIAYLFASIEGYSKIGNYKGNGAANGTFVYLGFRPAWVMIKAVTGITGQYWCIFDNVRDTFNDQNSQVLFVNAPDGEGTGGIDIDFLSNGMKMRDNGNNHNNSSGVYIYMAFAEAPFKYANAR